MITIQDTKEFHDLQELMAKMQLKFKVDQQEILTALLTEETVPASAFAQDLTPLQTIVVFLREKNYTFDHIGHLLNRDTRTVWQAFHDAPSHNIILDTIQYIIPIDVFANRTLSILEAVVTYLITTFDLTYSQTARIVNKDPRTIWTVFNRAKKKQSKQTTSKRGAQK